MNKYTMPQEKEILLAKVLDSLTDEQKDIMRAKICEEINEDLDNVALISYPNLVSDLFFQVAGDEWINFEDIPEWKVLSFIARNNNKGR